MNTYVKIQDNQYPAIITGRIHDSEWNDRSSKAIRLEMSYEDAIALFVDDVKWDIVQDIETIEYIQEEVVNEETGMVELIDKEVHKVTTETYDNSEYNIVGDITNHRDGTVTIKMGKTTAEEMLAMLEEVL